MLSALFNKLSLFIILLCFFAIGCKSTPEGKKGATFGGIVGGVLANVAAKNSKHRALWTILGAALGSSLGKKIEKHLNEKEKRQMELATMKALDSNGASEWKSNDNNISGSAKVTNTENTSEQTQIVVLKKRINEVPPLDVIGAKYSINSNSNLRGGPGTEYEKVGKVATGDILTVVGKVKGKDWYLVSQGGVGTGFIYSKLVSPVEADKNMQETEAAFNDNETQEIVASVDSVCREVTQSVQLDSGETVQDTIRACKGPDGWQIVS